jgi:CBS domain-containing protein
MTNSVRSPAAKSRLVLQARTAQELMAPDPVSIEADAPIREAAALLTDRAISAAPVIDEAGRPVGVVSRTDIVAFERERVEHVPSGREYYNETDRTSESGERLGAGFEIEDVDHTPVREVMTPVVFSVPLIAPAERVVEELLEKKVHRLFVVDPDGVLVGVITATDVLRHLAAST